MLKNKALCSNKEEEKEKHFFLPFAAKRPRVNAASVLDDYLLSTVYCQTGLGLRTSEE